MVADVADDDEFRTGERREGLFFGLLNLGEKLAAGGAVLVAGVLLEHFVRLTDATVQTQTAVERIGLVYGVLPALVLAGAAVSLIGYRLGRETVRGLQTRLCNRPAGRP
jgi:GPH family glycoside/pentoside/hexuronide:cation symporter